MDSVGTEVGQKMRSAIKAKLMELGCYVDDELPDYIMVMVANRRTKTQMEKDLQLFLRSNTKVFVDWLQKVLKKLEEVTITNPEAYACSSFGELKRKATLEIAECVVKKEKKATHIKTEKTKTNKVSNTSKYLTDEIPGKTVELTETRNEKEQLVDLNNVQSHSRNIVSQSHFNSLSIPEANEFEDTELDESEEKIFKSGNRLITLDTKSDSEDDDFINIKADAEELGTELNYVGNQATLQSTIKHLKQKSLKRTLKLNRPEVDDNANESNSQPAFQKPVADLRELLPNRNKVVSRKDSDSEINTVSQKPNKICLTETLREEKKISGQIRSSVTASKQSSRSKKHESVHKRLGGLSSIVTKPKRIDTSAPKTLPSVVQVKPRRPLPGLCQANKNLLLKAVAEAQKSITQMQLKTQKEIPYTEEIDASPLKEQKDKNSDALFTKKYLEQQRLKAQQQKSMNKKVETDVNSKVKNIVIQMQSANSVERKSADKEMDETGGEYVSVATVSEPDANIEDSEFVPSTIDLNYDDLEDYDSTSKTKSSDISQENSKPSTPETNHQFIVTLDGMKGKSIDLDGSISPTSTTNLGEIQKPKKRPPSPIIFDKGANGETPKKIPKVLPLVAAPKIKERCKYFPNCRSGLSCEYMHPVIPCKMFPICKFGDRCLYSHPKCKFDASCTRKDCPYSHGTKLAIKTVVKSAAFHVSPQLSVKDVCKYHPNCTNPHCQFLHPRPCRFGKNCINKFECNFSHDAVPSKEKLTWYSASK